MERSRLTGAKLAALAATLGACIQRVPFSCTDDAACVRPGEQGVCQPNHYCSFPDSSCESGQRYGENSGGDLGGECVETVGGDGGGIDDGKRVDAGDAGRDGGDAGTMDAGDGDIDGGDSSDGAVSSCPPPAPEGCNLDGDGLPPVECTTSVPDEADTVACVCPKPPCGAAFCDEDASTITDALIGIGAVTAPSVVWIFSGTYAGFTVSNAGTGTGTPLSVVARCASGTRDAVTVTSGVALLAPSVRLEGLRIDLGTLLESGVLIEPAADYATLRDLTITGEASGSAGSYVDCQGWSSTPVEGLLLEGVDVYSATAGFTWPAYFIGCPGAVVRNSSACFAADIGAEWYVADYSDGMRFESSFGTAPLNECFRVGGNSSGVTFDGIVADDCEDGIVIEPSSGVGSVIRNSRFSQSLSGVMIWGAEGVEVFNNVFAANSDGLYVFPSDVPLSVGRVAFNTFVDNARGLWARGSAVSPITVTEFQGNLFTGHFEAAVRREDATALVALENLYWDNTEGTADNCACEGSTCAFLNECFEGLPVPELDPLYVEPELGTYFLSQPPDQTSTSPGIDFTSLDSSEVCSEEQCLNGKTTSTAGLPDTGNADVGFHYPICP